MDEPAAASNLQASHAPNLTADAPYNESQRDCRVIDCCFRWATPELLPGGRPQLVLVDSEAGSSTVVASSSAVAAGEVSAVQK